MFFNGVTQSLLPLAGGEGGRRPDEGAFAGSVAFKSFTALLAALLILAAAIPVDAADDRTTFSTGKDLETALSVRRTWSSIGAPLASQLLDFQTQSNVAILRDRRTDPRRLVDMETEFIPRIQVLKRISESVPGTSLCRTDKYVCIGPKAAVHRLPILLERNRTQINALRKTLKPAEMRKLSSETVIAWPKLSEPRQLLLNHAKSVGATIANPERIPHDAWDEGRLPRMSLAEFCTLVLNQFDLTFLVASDVPTLTIVAIDPAETLEHRYSVRRELQTAVAAAWRDKVPALTVKWSGANGTVTASLDEHAELYAMLDDLRSANDEVSDSGANADASLLTRTFQLNFKGATVGQLIDFLRRHNVPIEVTDADTAETKAIMTQLVDLEHLTEKQPGPKFFPLVFGKYFKNVDVRADRVVLSRE